MIYHYYDPWHGVQIYKPVATRQAVEWTSTSGYNQQQLGKISVVKSDGFTTLVVRDKSNNISFVVDLTPEEVTSLVERLTDDNGVAATT